MKALTRGPRRKTYGRSPSVGGRDREPYRHRLLAVGLLVGVVPLDLFTGDGFGEPSYASGYVGAVTLFAVGWVTMLTSSLLVAYRDDPPALARPAFAFGTVLVVGAILLFVSRFDCVFRACPA